MADYPPLNKFYTASYSANDRDFPVVAIRLDPRTAGYRVPEDLSPHPDSKRYPNHVFTGAQPASGDQIVTHIYEILPAPYVPFTRYDDDLGPIQGRRRSVKNEGQVARLGPDQRVNYEAREGSAIVYTEIEESWSVATDDDGNSLFPIRDRDFYDASRGAVQERRQLFVPTGEEEGSLENVNGVITQTSYEPYNEFLSVKIVQTYKVDGPRLIGNTTDNDRQQATVTVQRKAAKDYIPPSNTATRAVEVTREDAESVVERIVETPNIFGANTFSIERPDPLPQKFRIAATIRTSERNFGGTAVAPTDLTSGQLSKSEQQVNKFVKRVSETSRDTTQTSTIRQRATDNDRQLVTVTETLQQGDSNEQPTERITISSEALGNGQFIVTKSEIPEVFKGITRQKNIPDLTPQKFQALQEEVVFEETIAGEVPDTIELPEGTFSKSERQINKFVKRVSTTSRNLPKNDKSITEEILTSNGISATRVLTLSRGQQQLTIGAKLIDGNVEALGDGRTVKTETNVASIFTDRLATRSKPDLVPAKFQAAIPQIRREITIEGTVDPSKTFDLGQNEFFRSEQEITPFVKKVVFDVRNLPDITSLEETIITPQGQTATRTQTLARGQQTIQPDSKLIEGSVENLGDGRSVKTEVRVERVFDQKSITSERPDTIPAKFRALTAEVTEDFIEEIENFDGGVPPVLDKKEGEYQRTKQRISEFTQRTTVNKKDDENFEKLNATEYESAFDLKIPYEESITTEIPSGVPADVESLGDGKYLVKKYNVEEFELQLNKFRIEYPARVNLNLPNVLKSIEVSYDEESQLGSYDNDNFLAGSFSSVSLTDRGTVSATLAATPIFNIDIEEIWAQNLPAKTVIFFIKGPIVTEAAILEKAGVKSVWPVFKPQRHTITAIGKKLIGSVSVSVTASQQTGGETIGELGSSSEQKESSVSSTPIIVNIPPCLNGKITIQSNSKKEQKITAQAEISAIVGISRTSETILELDTEIDQVLPATSPTDVPRNGTYVIDTDIEFFKFGWFIVRATVFDAEVLK